MSDRRAVERIERMKTETDIDINDASASTQSGRSGVYAHVILVCEFAGASASFFVAYVPFCGVEIQSAQ